MAQYVYLIRNEDLYTLGLTNNLGETQQNLKPGVLEASLQADDAKEILNILRKNYSSERLPQSNYYRLTKYQYLECKQKLEGGKNQVDFKPIFSGPILIFTFTTIWIGLSMLIIKFGVEPIFNQFS